MLQVEISVNICDRSLKLQLEMDYKRSSVPDNYEDIASLTAESEPPQGTVAQGLHDSIIEEVNMITKLADENAHGDNESEHGRSSPESPGPVAGVGEPLEFETYRNAEQAGTCEACCGSENSSDDHSKVNNSSNDDCEAGGVENAPPGDEVDYQDCYRRRIRRNSKRKLEQDEHCPVCGVTVRVPELESHFQKEIENLAKIPKSLKKKTPEEKSISTTFVEVKSNRENRLSAKVARYAEKYNETRCPVCNRRLDGAQEEVNQHVLACIYEEESADEFVDVDSFEEYEFGDQTRVRAIDLVPGGYKSLLGLPSKKKNSENDEDLNVDVDGTDTFGKPQYTELDVIHNIINNSEVKELEQLRQAVMKDSDIEPHEVESRKWSAGIEDDKEKTEEKIWSGEQSSKEKIKASEHENQIVKCLICLEPYTKPVVSTTCWHVHCEECWLMTMGVKKLCPQCNMIVFPSDLRRIYL